MRIHQFHSGSAVADAITNCMLFVQSMIQGRGYESEIFVQHIDPLLSGKVWPFSELAVKDDDLLLIHHSMGHDVLPRLANLRCHKFLVYHNITPPRFFSEDDPSHRYSIIGYSQLSELREIVEGAIAVSEFNARQLCQRGFTNVTVIPLLKDFSAVRYVPHAKSPYYDELPVFRILFVGKMAPHKCQHQLVDFVGRIQRIGDAPIELVLVGQVDASSDYGRRLDGQVYRLGLDRQVKMTGRIADRELFGWYRAASAYVSLSEHEGFGVPLIEAMAFDLPVIAYAVPGVAETLGEAGVIIRDKHPESILEPLNRLHTDRRFKAGVIRSQRTRLLRFAPNRIENELKRWLSNLAADEPGIKNAGSDAPLDDPARCSPRTHYIVEGPFETSYSLANTNRQMAFALDQREGRVGYIEPAEGVEDYTVDCEAANGLPDTIRSLVRQPPATAERIVTIRHMYPPRPNGMLGDVRLIHLPWEESALPAALAGLINLHLDGVLAASEFCKRVIRDSGVRLPIAVISHGIDHVSRSPKTQDDWVKPQRVTSSTPFTFLHISSGLARKGVEELITAYCAAFSVRDPVLLVIKTFDNPTNVVDTWVARLTSGSSFSPAIQVISEELDLREMDRLYCIADAVVLPTRGEAFNLPAAEGMAHGLPVIATRHSGHLDFCNDGNSFLIDYRYELSTSHLHVPNSLWARPSLEGLAAAMRTVYCDARAPGTPTRARALRGQRDVLNLTWREVARKIDDFIEFLDKRPAMTRKIRLAWVSTYNAQCGIATYSEHLLEFFDANTFEIMIIADNGVKQLRPDPSNVVRLWNTGTSDLERIKRYILEGRFDAVFFQHQSAFFKYEDLADILVALHAEGIDTYVTLHKTMDLTDARLISFSQLGYALKSCTRLFVHSPEDVNRLKAFGLTKNVVFLPHGVIDREPLDIGAVRSLLGLSRCNPIIGTFGFLLPGKGLPDLIYSFALVLRRYPSAFLLMINADYPNVSEHYVSGGEHERCLALIKHLDIEDNVRLINEFLETDEILFLLNACDLIVYPYQYTTESASGAVRLGLAAGRPVATTPIPIFADLSEIVNRLPGTTAADMADGILELVGDEEKKAAALQRQREWVRNNSWANQAARIANIIIGCFEEARNTEVRAPIPMRSSHSQPSQVPEVLRSGVSGVLGEAELVAAERLLYRRAPPWPIRGRDRPRVRDAPQPDERVRRATTPSESAEIGPKRPVLLSGIVALMPRLGRKRAKQRLVTLADRARDSRNWRLAARYYRDALAQNPDNAPIWVQYGHALKESGNILEAETAYRKSIELDANAADTHLQLGHALKLQGRRNEAIAAYLGALAIDPALQHASLELINLGWTSGRIQRVLRQGASAR